MQRACNGHATIREVAERFSVHHTVPIHLGRGAIAVRRGRLTEAQVAEVVYLYKQGFTLLEIGQRFGVGQDTASRAVLKAGGTIRRLVPARARHVRLLKHE